MKLEKVEELHNRILSDAFNPERTWYPHNPAFNSSDELNDTLNYAPTSEYKAYDTGRRDEAGNPIMGSELIDKTMPKLYTEPQNEDWIEGVLPEDFLASKLYADYFYGKDEKREQIKKAHDLTGIRVETIANDPEVWEKVMKIVQRTEKLKKVPGMLDANGDLNMHRVYENMPYLKEIAEKRGTNEAVMMLHSAKGLQTVNDAYESEFTRFTGSVATGAKRGWYNIRKQLTYANAMVDGRRLTEAEREWVAYLDKQKEELPEYSYSGVGQALGAMIGGAAENIPMIASAQGLGVAVGGAALALTKNPTAALWVGRTTAVAVMGLEIGGSKYEENINKLDAKGRLMYTPTQAALLSGTQGLAEGVIEQIALQKIARTIFGRGDAKALRDLYTGAGAKDLAMAAGGVSANEAARALIKERILGAAKAGAITFRTELLEEFAQKISDMVIENVAQVAIKGDDAELSSIGKILQKSTAAAIEAVPSIMGFGLLGFGGHMGANVNAMLGARSHMENLMKDRLYRSVNENQNLINTVEAVGDNLKNVQELKGKAPDLVNEMLDSQNRRYGLETTSVDIVSLNQEEGGVELVQQIAEANSISLDELKACADGTGMLPVKTSTIQQLTTQLDDNQRKALFQNITKSPHLFTDKQVQHEAKIVKEIIGAFQEKTAEDSLGLVDRYVETAFTGHEHRALARDILLVDVNNPNAEVMRRKKEIDNELKELTSVIKGDESAEAAERLMHIQPEIEKLKAQKDALAAIEGTLKGIQPGDVAIAAELSPEARSVYHGITEQLGGAKSKKARSAARASAILAARYADRMAKVYSEVNGESYTAADYMREHLSVDVQAEGLNDGLAQVKKTSANQKLGKDTAVWEKLLDGFMSNPNKNSMRIYKVMETPLVFSLFNDQGFNVQIGKDIAISHAMLWKVLREKEVKGKSHGHALEMMPEIMKELPHALANPIMILRNRKGDDPSAPILPDEIVAVVDLQDKNGNTVIVPIVLKENNGKYMMKTFFGKNNPTWFQKRMMLGDVLYAHKKRALNWVKAIQRHQSPGRFTLQDSFFNSIPTEADLVKAQELNEGFYQSAWQGSEHNEQGRELVSILAQTTSARHLKEDMVAWKQKVDDFFVGKLPLRNNVMMHSPLVFDLIGADSSLDIAIDSSILQKLIDKHHFKRKDLLELPRKIANPLFVLRAIDTQTGVEDTHKRIIVVDMEINSATVMIPFVLNTSKGINKIASAYGREKASGLPNDQWYIDRLNQNNLLYVNKNRTARWVATRTGTAESHNAPLTKQSLIALSIPDEIDLGKLISVDVQAEGLNDGLKQAVRAGLNLDEQVQVVNLDTLTNDLQGKTDKDILDYISKASLLPEVSTADFRALVGLPKDSDSYGQRHLVRGNANQSTDNRIVRNITLSNFEDIAENAVVVEVVPNTKKAPLTGLRGKKRQVQKRKNQISNYYRLMVPVRMNDNIKTLVIVAEERDGVVSTGSVSVTAYEIYYAKKPPLAATPRPETGVSATEEETPLTISIRDMLTGVKDADGNVYEQSVSNVLPEQKENVRKQYEGTPQWMKAPNGKDTNLTEDQWLTVRTPAFKEKFGDWEKAETVREIRNLVPTEVVLTGKTLDKKKAEAVFSTFGEIENPRYGTYATFPKGMVGKIIKHRGLDVSQMISDIPHLFSTSVLAFVEPEYKKDGHKEHPNILAYHHYINKFTADGKTYYIRFSLREEKTKNPKNPSAKRILHSTGISDIRIYEENKKDVSSQRIRVSDPGEESKTSFIDSRLAGFFDSVKDAPQMPLDENGEPVFSGTLAQSIKQKHEVKGNIIATHGDTQRLISLTQSADQSTFMHEMAHNFLFDLEHIADIAPDSRYAKDLATIQKWASWTKGMADEYAGTASFAEFHDREEKILVAEKDGDTAEAERLKREWIQERFARGFEEYLRSGKAPAWGLRAVFRRFKAWLTRIYKDVKGAGVRASAEVEAIMARMIATDEEIEAAAVAKRAERLLKIAPELLDADSLEAIIQWEKEAKERAKETLLKEIISEMEARDVDAHMRDYEAKLKSEMRESHVWQAEAVAETFGVGQVIASGYYPTREAYQKALEDAGGSYDSVYNRRVHAERERYRSAMPSAEAISERAEEVLATEEYTRRQTALESELLSEYVKAYDNAPKRLKEAMISVARALERADDAPLEKAVTALKYSFRWQEKQAKEIEDLQAIVTATKEASKEKRAELSEKFEAAFNRLKLSAAQNLEAVRSIRDSAKGRTQAMRAYAKQRLETVPVHEATNVRHWVRQVRSAAKETERHLANLLRKNNGIEKEDLGSKNLAAARAAKTRQLAIEAMAYESIKLKRELGRMEKYFARLEKKLTNDKTGRIDGNHRYFIHHLLYAFGLRRSDGTSLTGSGARSWSVLMEELKSSYDGLDGVDIPEWLSSAVTARDNQRKYTKLSIEELRDLSRLVEFLYVTGRNKNTLLTSGENVDEVAARIYENYEEHIGVQDGGKEAHTYMVQLLKAETMLKVIGGKDGALMHYLYGTLFAAQEKKSEALEENARRLKTIIGQYYTDNDRRQMSNKKLGITLTDGTELTKENVLSMALNWGNKGNRLRLVAGLSTKTPYTEKDVEEIFAQTMTAKDWAFVQEIWDYLNEHGDAVNEVVEKTTGAPMKRVPPDAFTTVDAVTKETLTIRGGYYPIRYDPKRSDRAADQELANVAESVGGAMTFGTGMGSTKNRANKVPIGRPLDLSLDVMYRHIDQQIHIATMRLACRDVYKLLNHSAVKGPILQSFGKDAYDSLKRWCESTWQEPMSNNLYIETLAEEWRANTVTAIMAFRVSTAALNIANIAPMSDRLGTVNAIKAMLLYLRHPKQIRRFVLNDSVFIRNRSHNMDRDLNTQGKNIFGGKTPVRKFLINWGAFLLKETDMLCSVPTYYWAYRERYNKEVSDGTDEIIARERAHSEAHEAVRSVFGSSETIDRSVVQRSQSGLVKAFTPFFSFFNAQMNAVWEKYYAGRYDNNKEYFVNRYAAFVRSYLFRFVAMAAIETIIRQSFESLSAGIGDRKDKDEWYIKFMRQWAANSLGSVTSGFPFINAAGEVLQGAITGKLQHNRGSGVVFVAIGRFTDPIQMALSMQSETSKIDEIDFGRALTKAYLGTKHGIPDTLTDGFWNTVRFMHDNYRLNNPDDLREFIAKTILDKKLTQK